LIVSSGFAQPVGPGVNGLMAHWKLDDGSGFTADDLLMLIT